MKREDRVGRPWACLPIVTGRSVRKPSAKLCVNKRTLTPMLEP